MCGLFACLRLPHAKRHSVDVDAVLASLANRGPDGQGVMHFPTCTLAHTRLAIFDAANGQQPMADPETGVALAYNGEIYNAPELRRLLQTKGHVFSTRTDTEVILAAFLYFGQDCVAMFEGMFAFALWDPRTECLLLARDRMGEKPLFYGQTPDGWLVVASEIKTLVVAGIDPKLNPAALAHYLRWKYTAPDQPIYASVSSLPRAHSMRVLRGRMEKSRYWQLPASGGAKLSMGDAIEETGRLLSTSVQNRLCGDRPIGLSLSGGVDSTLIAAVATQHSRRCSAAFTLSYPSAMDEAPRARATALALGMPHNVISLTLPDPEALDAVAACLDQPHGDSANLAQALVCARASEDVAVLLSGDGADELFWGYQWYETPSLLRTRDQKMSIFETHERVALMGDHAQNDACDAADFGGVDVVNDFDLDSYLGGQLLPKADLLGMMHGVEVRAPFLDYHLVAFARSLPPELKSGAPSKPILRALLAQTWPDLLPPTVKQGFGAPLVRWLSDPAFASYVHDRLSSGAKIRGILDPIAVDHQLKIGFSNLTKMNAYRIWVLLCLELWAAAQPALTLGARQA